MPTYSGLYLQRLTSPPYPMMPLSKAQASTAALGGRAGNYCNELHVTLEEMLSGNQIKISLS